MLSRIFNYVFNFRKNDSAFSDFELRIRMPYTDSAGTSLVIMQNPPISSYRHKHYITQTFTIHENKSAHNMVKTCIYENNPRKK